MGEADLQRQLKGVPKDTYGNEHASHLLEQYKLYVQMADKISERRQTANTFFLTINTALVAMLGIAWRPAERLVGPMWYLIVGVSGLVLCYSWYRLVRSYRDLNSGKFRIVHAIEQLLPIRPYDAEWTIVGRGEDPKLYLPFTHVETKVPWVFFILYLVVIVIAGRALRG
jgi:hypothetical protein